MRAIGQAIQLFANDLSGRIPFSRNRIQAGPWATTMNSRDFFYLTDTVGLPYKNFIDPSLVQPPSSAIEATVSYYASATTTTGTPSAYPSTTTESVCRYWTAKDYGPDASDPRWGTYANPNQWCDFVIFPYQYYGVEWEGAFSYQAKAQSPWTVLFQGGSNSSNTDISLLGGNSTTPAVPVESNPPILSDYAYLGWGEYRYNHNDGASLQSAWSNVLRGDGSVEGHKIGSTPAFTLYYGGAAFYR